MRFHPFRADTGQFVRAARSSPRTRRPGEDRRGPWTSQIQRLVIARELLR
ncbi:MAG TPA: hypothetical protein VGK67_29920 [Myxococcales bacterium]|jgi:hypothetical protein